ncbi:MAG: hypothetical protein N4J56_005430 [Chroococcidiopsis sp. SAG 2025]|uniref:Uncharacterized protein n=1 Tax=Chroococcidiopsis thermalis (strain PCC 7203) TaxID=251229 RepID=K9U576_CHRTP|nr:hypothetical protein Chro_4873 [Chroococcidiopsis thermalis PCC 7203]MDV2995776.1 hypothetical protein [Chroococcidiopsis sp. SAG 2025]
MNLYLFLKSQYKYRAIIYINLHLLSMVGYFLEMIG